MDQFNVKSFFKTPNRSWDNWKELNIPHDPPEPEGVSLLSKKHWNWYNYALFMVIFFQYQGPSLFKKTSLKKLFCYLSTPCTGANRLPFQVPYLFCHFQSWCWNFLIIKFPIETMVLKKCGICGVHNFRNKTVIIFDVSKRQFRDGRTYKYLCERHFKPSDTYSYSDGRKRLVGYSYSIYIIILVFIIHYV